MSARRLSPRWQAGLIAAALFGLGAVAGVVADRAWTARSAGAAPAPPLTVGSMADALGLDAPTRARVQALLDSLQPEIARAAVAGPDSLREATRNAHARLMEALPPDRRAEFQRWLDAHHARMLERMRRMMPGMMGPGGRPGMGPGMMGPGGMRPGSAGMRPGGRASGDRGPAGPGLGGPGGGR